MRVLARYVRWAAVVTGAGDLGAALRRGHPDPSILAGGLTGVRHPVTSRVAAVAELTEVRRTIARFVHEAGVEGVVAADLVYAGLTDSVQLAGARLLELRGDRVGYTRRAGRIYTADGWVTRQRAGYQPGIVHVHVAYEADLPDGQRLAPSLDRSPCSCCGHVRRTLPWPPVHQGT